MPFSQFLTEAEEGVEFIVKILVRGNSNTADEDLFMQCHENCQWLNRADTEPKCILFKGALKVKKVGEVSHALRSPNCLSATDSLT